MTKAVHDEPESKNETPSSTRRGRFRAEDSLRVSLQLMTEVVSGTADAVSEGFRAFADELSRENVRERGLVNGLFEGTVVGQTRFLRTLANTGDKVQERFRDLEVDFRVKPVSEPIDYERLAKAVVAAMREEAKGQK